MSPFCERCSSDEDLTTDHVQPTSHGGPLFAPLTGLRVLCRACHGRVWPEQVAEQLRVSPPDVPAN